MRLELTLLLLALLGYSQGCSDKLQDVPDILRRDVDYKRGADEKLVNDRFLKAGEYKTPSSQTLANTAPGVASCATRYPIWRKAKTGITSIMCIQTNTNTCYKQFSITTRMEDGKEIFNLKKSPIYFSGYCFQKTVNDNPPAPVAAPIVELDVLNDGPTSELVFFCKFNKHQDDKILYKTYWSVGGEEVHVAGPTAWDSQLIQNHALTEALLGEAGITKPGFNVRCSVTASFAAEKPESTPNWSESKFIGIKFSPSRLVLKEGETAQITLQLTAPFGCGQSTNEEWCGLRVESQGFGNVKDVCSATTKLTAQTCGVEAKPEVWEKTLTLDVFAQISKLQTKSVRTTQIQLKTADMLEHPFWGNYDVGTISVQLVKDSSPIKSKSCYSVMDPHMKTFDGRRYEQHIEGTFTLYQHPDYPIEVQHKVQPCCPSCANIMCNCGVAVKVGESVFEVSRCDGEPTWFADYSVCRGKGDLLRVKKKGDVYEIYLPTGGKVEVSVRVLGNTLQVKVFPSIQDYMKSQGLCGYLSDNCTDDFVMRDGSYSTDDTSTSACGKDRLSHLRKFAKSWMVDEQQNLFNHQNFDSQGFLQPWTQPLAFCECEEKTILNPEVQCKSTEPYKDCGTLPGYLDVPSKCILTKDKKVPRPGPAPGADEARKAEWEQWEKKDWSDQQATAHCQDVFNKSPTVQACRGVVKKDVATSLEDCVLDIKLTGTIAFVDFAVDSVRSACLEEVQVNPDFHEPLDDGLSVFDIVANKVCPFDCSGRGECKGGVCECEGGVTGPDCSVNSTGTLVLLSVGDKGICDTSKSPCEEFSVYGGPFVEGDTDFLFEKIKVYQSRTLSRHRMLLPAAVISQREMRFRFPRQRGINPGNVTQEDVKTIYRITAVSRASGVRSNSVLLTIFSGGECVETTVRGKVITWEVTGPNCVEGAQCFPARSPHPWRNCLTCTVTDGVGSWTARPVSLVESSSRPGGVTLVNAKHASKTSDSMDLVQIAGQVHKGDKFTRANAGSKLSVIADEIKHLQEQARKVLEDAKINGFLHHVACNLVKKPGHIHVYYLYERESGQKYFSILSPQEWGPSCPSEFLGGYRLENDQSWTPMEDMDRRGDEIALIDKILNAQQALTDSSSVNFDGLTSQEESPTATLEDVSDKPH